MEEWECVACVCEHRLLLLYVLKGHLTMKRERESVASNQNKKKSKEEGIIKDEGAILKFMEVSSEMLEVPPGPSRVSSSEAGAAQNQEAAEIVQVHNSDDLLGPVIDTIILSTSSASDGIAEIMIPDQTVILSAASDFVRNDIGKWAEKTDSNI
ncbi:uncharacterized protein LOC126457756 isoform X4 [Schistocerca serialis cubense]|uniref:uncharacterized protein LOC126457756 isoform X4 n=1 Tax=Schistocerca serialis cubense TaxID=2023355 RepID=UPI00214E11C2|nr:uncharacterized protein LOC126457756 isoform X4 [Schistocerca serialis cubense]